MSSKTTTEMASSALTLDASTGVLVRAIVGSQKILADYLEPGGTSREQAINLLLGVLDHRDVVAAVASITKTA